MKTSKKQKKSPLVKQRRLPNEIRLLINRECNYKCSFPRTCTKWCHEDGGVYFKKGKRQAVNEDFLFLAQALQKPFDLFRAKIGGMEPLLFPQLPQLINGLKKVGFAEVSLTTNGYFLDKRVQELSQAKLDNLTVSIHAFSRKKYREITQVDAFERVLRGIKKAQKLGLKDIKVNRVMLNLPGAWQDLQRFLKWAQENKITAKLYQLIWSPGMEEELFFKHFFSWRALLVFLAKKGKLQRVDRYFSAGRERLFWKLDSGLKIETDIFYHKATNTFSPFCQRCPLTAVCQEGIFSYGLEINSELILSPCLLRNDLYLDLWELVKKRKKKQLVAKVKKFIDKLTK